MGDADETFRLLYRSVSRLSGPRRRAALGELFSVARSNNKKRGITGALLLTQDCFVQALEGDEQVVRALYARIECDPRHEAVELLEARAVDARFFARWAMARITADGERDLPLIAHQDGISAAAPRGDATPEQEQVLDLMRAASRAAPSRSAHL